MSTPPEDNTRKFGFLRRHRFEIDAPADVEAGVVRWQRRLRAASPPTRTLSLASAACLRFDRWHAGSGVIAIRSLMASA